MRAEHKRYGTSDSGRGHVWMLRAAGYTFRTGFSFWTGRYGFSDSPGFSLEIGWHRDLLKQARRAP